MEEEKEAEHQRLAGLLMLADQATGAERLDLLHRAVELGMQLWAAELAGVRPVCWWEDGSTRPFMRAIMAYGRLLADQDEPVKAALCYKALLAIHPEDALGAQNQLHKLPFWFDGAEVMPRANHMAAGKAKN
jgi:hypothetical protein